MDTQLSSNIQLQLPPGFRFHPSDEELIIHYLRNKATSSPIPASIIAEVDLYKYNPWELPSLYHTTFFFFLYFPLFCVLCSLSKCHPFSFSFFFGKQPKLCLDRMNGISLHQEIGSIQMEWGLIEQQLQVTGRLLGPINQFSLPAEQGALGSRKLSCSTKGALQRELRRTGSCMSIDYSIQCFGLWNIKGPWE